MRRVPVAAVEDTDRFGVVDRQTAEEADEARLVIDLPSLSVLEVDHWERSDVTLRSGLDAMASVLRYVSSS